MAVVTANPFMDQFDAHGYLHAGDAWARVALEAADRARACWARADELLETAERAAKELELKRGEDVWGQIQAALDAEREVLP